MRLDDRLSKNNINKAIADAKADEYYAEEPDWMIYDVRKRQNSIDKDRGVFDVDREHAINTAKSVFDAQAIFHTSPGTGDQ